MTQNPTITKCCLCYCEQAPVLKVLARRKTQKLHPEYTWTAQLQVAVDSSLFKLFFKEKGNKTTEQPSVDAQFLTEAQLLLKWHYFSLSSVYSILCQNGLTKAQTNLCETLLWRVEFLASRIFGNRWKQVLSIESTEGMVNKNRSVIREDARRQMLVGIRKEQTFASVPLQTEEATWSLVPAPRFNMTKTVGMTDLLLFVFEFHFSLIFSRFPTHNPTTTSVHLWS